jgi:hypothetical protein
MSWSYSGDPSASDLDQCRFWLQDVDTTYQLMQDEELNWLIAQSDPMQAAPLYAASVAAEVLANRYAKEVSVSADGVSVALGELQDKFNKLAENLRGQWHEIVAALGDYDFAGIVMDVNSWDETIMPLVFGIGFMDNYEAGQQDYGYYSPGGYSKELAAETGGAMISSNKTKNPNTDAEQSEQGPDSTP